MNRRFGRLFRAENEPPPQDEEYLDDDYLIDAVLRTRPLFLLRNVRVTNQFRLARLKRSKWA
ncbi:MAG: hypothetical protein J0G35_06925, partial [Acidobacteriales bacterium]|nr:hypothetical protein [Terriglobales bacterium]